MNWKDFGAHARGTVTAGAAEARCRFAVMSTPLSASVNGAARRVQVRGIRVSPHAVSNCFAGRQKPAGDPVLAIQAFLERHPRENG